MENPASPEKTSKEVLLDYAKEIVGYENGLLRTLIDLRKQPEVVLQGYLAKDLKYVSPFRLLISALSLWVLVNSFFLDWHKTWENLMFRMSGWTQSLIGPDKDQEKFEAVIAPIANLTGRMAGDLFSKYYVPF